MQKIIKITAAAIIAFALLGTGCASTKGGRHACGCTGMIGYK